MVVMKILIFSFIGAHTGQSQSTHPKESSKSLVLSGKALNGKKWHDIPSHSQILTQLKPTYLFLLTRAATIWDIWRTLYTLSANNDSSKYGVAFTLGEPKILVLTPFLLIMAIPNMSCRSAAKCPVGSNISCREQLLAPISDPASTPHHALRLLASVLSNIDIEYTDTITDRGSTTELLNQQCWCHTEEKTI